MKEFEPTVIPLEKSILEERHSEPMAKDDDGEDAASVGVNEDSNLEPDTCTIDSNGPEPSQYQANKAANVPQVQMKLLEVATNEDTMAKVCGRIMENYEIYKQKSTSKATAVTAEVPASSEAVLAKLHGLVRKKYEEFKRSLEPSAITTAQVTYPKPKPQRPLIMKSLEAPAKDEKPSPSTTASPAAKSLVAPENEDSFVKLRESVAGIIKKYEARKNASSSLASSKISNKQGFHMSEDEDSGGPSAKRLRRNTEDEDQSGFSRRFR